MPQNDAFTLSLLTNSEVIRVNQHTENNKEISFDKGISIWTADDTDGSKKYMAVLNINDSPERVTLPLEEAGMESKTIKNLWTSTEFAVTSNAFTIEIPAHGAGLFSVETAHK